jgi:phosphatidylserine/phosphatidylglycerophosphate/cardiolipin synthase-like enzyme
MHRIILSLSLSLFVLVTPSTSVFAADITQSTPTIEVAFSPDGDAESLVLKIITAAKHSIRVASFSFTSQTIAGALKAAKKRGVDVAVMVDYETNLNNKSSQRALNILANAGIATRTVSTYSSHHDKYMVVDDLNVETGSYNFTTSAARFNSENVLVVWNDPAVAKQYLAHWQSRWAQGEVYKSSY